MILESGPWKKDLKYRARIIKQNNTRGKLLNDDDGTAYTGIEKGIFYSAFIIRKLMDCMSKVSDGVDNYQLPVNKRKPIKRIDFLERAIDESTHDWNNYVVETISAREICNQLIHSFLFSINLNKHGVVSGFFVASDRDKQKALYYIKLSEWLSFIDYVANDDIVGFEMKQDDNGGYVFTKKERG